MKRIFLIAVTIASTIVTSEVSADVLFESGTLGPTGITWSDITNGIVPDTVVSPFVFSGVRFRLNQSVVTTKVGGHFASPSSGTFFGTIVSLDNENDFPDSFDFSTSDFRGATSLNFPNPSDEVFGSLSLSLEPGWYALVFGSGLFGTNGAGGAVRNGTDLGEPTYIAAQPFSGVSNWFDIATELPNHRFVLQGRIVPEPSALCMAFLLSMLVSCIRCRDQRLVHLTSQFV